jgi:hypothetical protein
MVGMDERCWGVINWSMVDNWGGFVNDCVESDVRNYQKLISIFYFSLFLKSSPIVVISGVIDSAD